MYYSYAKEIKPHQQTVVSHSLFCETDGYKSFTLSVLNAYYTLLFTSLTRNSSGDEIANVNFLYDDIVHALKIQ